MCSTAREHIGAGLVAAGIVAAAFAQGLFEPKGYAAASIVIWAAVIAGVVGRGLPAAPIARPAAVAGICLAATAVLGALSIAWAADQGRAFEEMIRVSFYLGIFALAACTASRAGIGQWLVFCGGIAGSPCSGCSAYLQPVCSPTRATTSQTPQAASTPRLLERIGRPFAVGAILSYGGTQCPHPLRSQHCAVPIALLGIWLTDSRRVAAADRTRHPVG
jgi:hypothetical protein